MSGPTRLRITAAVAATLGIAGLATGCSGVSKLDPGHLFSRAGWQLPERVVASLEIEPGDRVADVGAGDGYFLPYFARAVGPLGIVYAVEVDDESLRELALRVREEELANVVVVKGELGDPLLPDGGIDLVFLCNTYHHIEQRPAYFARLRRDLDADGQVAVVDPDADLTGVLRLFQHEGHMTDAAALDDEMRQAGYRSSVRHRFLPTQIFAVFTPEARAD